MTPLSALAAMLLRCALLTTGSSVVSALCSHFGVWVLALFVSVGFGIAGLGMPAGLLDDRKTPFMVVSILSFVVISTAGILAMGMVEHRLWQNTVADIGVAQAGEHAWASGFRFRDGVVRADLAGDATLSARNRRRLATLYVVPVVPDGWTKEQPVLVWAVATNTTIEARRARWQEPCRAGARIVGFNLSDYREAMDDACRHHHITAAGNPVFLDWRPDPENAVSESWRLLLTILGISAAVIVIAVLIAWPFAPAPRA